MQATVTLRLARRMNPGSGLPGLRSKGTSFEVKEMVALAGLAPASAGLPDRNLVYFDLSTLNEKGLAALAAQQAEKDTCLGKDLRRIIVQFAIAPSRFVPRHRGLRAPHGVSLHGCQFFGSGE